jgi:hypothetical protein
MTTPAHQSRTNRFIAAHLERCRNPVGVATIIATARKPKVAEYSNLGLWVATTSWLLDILLLPSKCLTATLLYKHFTPKERRKSSPKTFASEAPRIHVLIRPARLTAFEACLDRPRFV